MYWDKVSKPGVAITSAIPIQRNSILVQAEIITMHALATLCLPIAVCTFKWQDKGISSWMLKSTASSITFPFLTSQSQLAWCRSNGNLLSSLISKLLEKHIHSVLSDFCISRNLVSLFQFGFMPNRSTVSAFLYSTHSILSLLEDDPSVSGIFLT